MSMTISIDDELKKQFSEVCKELGLSPSAAFSVFAKAVVRERRIPFEISAESSYERARREYERDLNAALWEGYQEVKEGRECTREEFEAALEQMRGVA